MTPLPRPRAGGAETLSLPAGCGRVCGQRPGNCEVRCTPPSTYRDVCPGSVCPFVGGLSSSEAGTRAGGALGVPLAHSGRELFAQRLRCLRGWAGAGASTRAGAGCSQIPAFVNILTFSESLSPCRLDPARRHHLSLVEMAVLKPLLRCDWHTESRARSMYTAG